MGHAGVFLLYAALTFGGLVFAYILVPETKGLSLEAVQALWTKRTRGRAASAGSAPRVVR
jgi:hypothetical protein